MTQTQPKLRALFLAALMVLSVAAGSIAFAGAAAATNHLTVTSGESIQDAIDNASVGDTIVVENGTYAEDLTVNKSLTIVSTDGASDTTIQGQGNNANDITVAADGVTIEGFDIDPASGATYTVYVQPGVSNFTFNSNDVESAAGGALVTGDAQTGHSIAGNTFSRTTNGVLVYVNGNVSLSTPSSDITLADNEFAGDVGGGVALGLEAIDASVTGNEFEASTSYTTLELWLGGADVSDNSFNGDGSGAKVIDQDGSLDIPSTVAANEFNRAVTETGGSTIWSSIQDGVDAASTGDTVEVRPGTYDEAINAQTDGLNIVAPDGATISPSQSTMDANSRNRIVDLGWPEGDNLTFEGFDITGPDDVVAITVAANDSVVRDNHVSGVLTGIQTSSGGSSGATIEDNVVENVVVGISLQMGENTIHDNTIRNASLEGMGVALVGKDGQPITGNEFSGNVFEDMGETPNVQFYALAAGGPLEVNPPVTVVETVEGETEVQHVHHHHEGETITVTVTPEDPPTPWPSPTPPASPTPPPSPTPPASPTPPPSPTPPEPVETPGQPGFGIGAALVALFAAGLLAHRRRG